MAGFDGAGPADAGFMTAGGQGACITGDPGAVARSIGRGIAPGNRGGRLQTGDALGRVLSRRLGRWCSR